MSLVLVLHQFKFRSVVSAVVKGSGFPTKGLLFGHKTFAVRFSILCREFSGASEFLVDQGILGGAGSSKENKRRLVPLKTERTNILTWYACGPTVYDSAHIGHASSYIRLDVIRRILESRNVSVLQVMGITDIDDKIIGRSNKLKIPWNELSRKYELEFFNDLNKLNVLKPHVTARVSDFVPNIIQFVSELIENGMAYTTLEGNVYFDTEKYGRYGKFRQSNDEGFSEEEVNSEKKNRKDFALWKGYKPGEPFWETKWGHGRPGWHIECSVMASHFFGSKLDLHSGGADLIFPHHENEEAQCCAKFGHSQWVSHWIHTGHLIVKGDVKMSKSLGNTITIEEFLRNSSPEVLRMMCILSPYTNMLEFTEESKSQASAVLRKIETFIGNCNAIICGQQVVLQKPGSQSSLWEKILHCRTVISEALVTNFDTAKALMALIDMISDFNRSVEVLTKHVTGISNGVDLAYVMNCKQLAQGFLTLVGIGGTAESSETHLLLDPIMTEFIRFRNLVRTYSLALEEDDKAARKLKIKERHHLIKACDEVRDSIKVFGVEIEDTGKDSNWFVRRQEN